MQDETPTNPDAFRARDVGSDVTEPKVTEREHLAHLWLFESLERVNQAIQGVEDLEQMRHMALSVLLEIFDCDRAWLFAPDLASGSEEVSRPGFETTASERIPFARWATPPGDAGGAQRFGAASGATVPVPLSNAVAAGAIMFSELYVKGSERHVLAVHHCRGPRTWTDDQQRLFRVIGRCLGDAIVTLSTARRLRESEQRLEAAQRRARLGYWSLDLKSATVTFSAETFRICGLEPSDAPLALHAVEAMLHPSDLERGWKTAWEALRGNGEYRRVHRVLCPSSELRYVHTEGRVVRDRNGKPTSLFGTAQDITERKRAEQLFAAQHAVTKLLAELPTPEQAMPCILRSICETLDWDVGLSWSISEGSSRSCPVAVWCSPDVAHRSWVDDPPATPREVEGDAPWFASNLGERDNFRAAFGFTVSVGGRPWARLAFFTLETRQPHADLLAAMTTLGSQVGQFVERRQSEAALQRAREQLAHVTRVASLGELAASLAHEVNQPLTGIIGNAQAAQRWLKREPPQLREADECLQRLVRDGKRAGEVISRLRSLVRRGETTRRAIVDVNQVVRDTLPLVRAEVQQNDVALTLELGEGLAPVSADQVQLQQVVLNLILNAVESMLAVHDRPRELLIRTAERNADELTVTVADSGVGVNAQQAARIFDAFFTTKHQGMGMGLAISRSIVEDHGGRLSLAPSPAVGSAFEFTLPKAPP